MTTQFVGICFQLKIQICFCASLNSIASVTLRAKQQHIPLKRLCSFATIPLLIECRALSPFKTDAWESQTSRYLVGDHVILEMQETCLDNEIIAAWFLFTSLVFVVTFPLISVSCVLLFTLQIQTYFAFCT